MKLSGLWKEQAGANCWPRRAPSIRRFTAWRSADISARLGRLRPRDASESTISSPARVTAIWRRCGVNGLRLVRRSTRSWGLLMSQSFAHDRGSERSGGAPDGSSNESFDDQLAAEIADHLAAAADDLVRRGEAEDQAARMAIARFGDVARIKRQCWWIHNGEDVMFRTAGIVLLSLLTIGVAVVGFGGWQLQRNLASRTEELSGQLASLTTTQQAMLAQQRPPEITGLAYLGDPSKPAKDVEIKVFRFSDETPSNMGMQASGVGMRRLRTDALGHFDSGILQSGEYCLLAPLVDPEGNAK